MGLPSIKTLHDLAKMDANLRVACVRCDRSADFDRGAVIQYFQHRHWNTAWELVPGRFRCRRCNQRGPRLLPAPRTGPPQPARLAPPRPIAVREGRRR